METKTEYRTTKRVFYCLTPECGNPLGMVYVRDGRSYLRTSGGNRICRGELVCPACGAARRFNSSKKPA